MKSSLYLEEAVEILQNVKGRPLSLEERKKASIVLAAHLLQQAELEMESFERDMQSKLSCLISDPASKMFTTAVTDQCFRSASSLRTASQITYLISLFGIPKYLGFFERFGLLLFKLIPPFFSKWLIPIVARRVRRETRSVILPGEKELLKTHLHRRLDEGARVNLNHLGEAILSEEEAKDRLQVYLEDLKNPDIQTISIKISTIFSQINVLSFEETVDVIAGRLQELYRAAMQPEPKFVNLDMEEYRDLKLTTAVFMKVLSLPEFQSYFAGIVLQAYLPDAHLVQQELTEWAKKRVRLGGAPIKIRLVKGANLAMEQCEASLKGWPQAPYSLKMDVDANYKKMILYGLIPENARAARIGVASHNLFDIAFSLLLRSENEVEPYVEFEMLEGMAEALSRVIRQITGELLLYCPVAKKQEFQYAIAYLTRRLDENTGEENFLRYSFGLRVGSDHWKREASAFSQSCDAIPLVFVGQNRMQNRQLAPGKRDLLSHFENEPDTDFALIQNRVWAKNIAEKWEKAQPDDIPLVIAGKEVFANTEGVGILPSEGGRPFFRYAQAKRAHFEEALLCSKYNEAQWGKSSVEHRASLLIAVAQKLRERRGELIGCMMQEGAKTVVEADAEVSEAIDFAEYYAHQALELSKIAELSFRPKGTLVVISPWNFPCAIPVGGIMAALVMGNCVLFKPSSSAVLVGWHLCQAIWDAGVPKEICQFIPCSGEDVGGDLICDMRVNGVILTGGTSTAQRFLKMRPDLSLAAETGGKNAIIITSLVDRDLAIKELLSSAFSHAGQKCSAASLAILEAEVYDDLHFLKQLRNAARSMKVASPFDLTAKIPPLIRPPAGVLQRALTSLEPGEEWLLKPEANPENPHLWTPGIKLHVKPGSFTHMTELFGPVLGVMRAENLSHAIQMANAVPYGLTSGLFTLDEREKTLWKSEVEAGNLYINRQITGAIVQRQPFGGTKLSCFGSGSKAGGPNYLKEMAHIEEKALPREKAILPDAVSRLGPLLGLLDLSSEELGVWFASVSNYAHAWEKMKIPQDHSHIRGQENLLYYTPRKCVSLRVGKKAKAFDILRVCAAALTCKTALEVSFDPLEQAFPWTALPEQIVVLKESERDLIDRMRQGKIHRLRMVEKAPYEILKTAADMSLHVEESPVLACGRFELLHYVREVALSHDFHRYGNLVVV